MSPDKEPSTVANGLTVLRRHRGPLPLGTGDYYDPRGIGRKAAPWWIRRDTPEPELYRWYWLLRLIEEIAPEVIEDLKDTVWPAHQAWRERHREAMNLLAEQGIPTVEEHPAAVAYHAADLAQRAYYEAYYAWCERSGLGKGDLGERLMRRVNDTLMAWSQFGFRPAFFLLLPNVPKRTGYQPREWRYVLPAYDPLFDRRIPYREWAIAEFTKLLDEQLDDEELGAKQSGLRRTPRLTSDRRPSLLGNPLRRLEWVVLRRVKREPTRLIARKYQVTPSTIEREIRQEERALGLR